MSAYIGVIHKDHDSDYGVSFPDFPGCITAGSTVEEAKKMAYEALLFHIQGMIGDDEKLPIPSKLEEICRNDDFADGIAFLIVSVPDQVYSDTARKAA